MTWANTFDKHVLAQVEKENAALKAALREAILFYRESVHQDLGFYKIAQQKQVEKWQKQFNLEDK